MNDFEAKRADFVKKMAVGLKKFRKHQGYNQDQICEIIGMHKQNYSKVERGIRLLSLANIYLIAQHFDVTIDYIIHFRNG